PMPVQVLGFVSNMAEWMAAADLMVSKAGPGTLAEAACLGLPTLISEFIPGQETGNVEWFEQHGAAIYEPHPEKLAHYADELLRPGNPLLPQMAKRARDLGRPHAAAEIAEVALSLVRVLNPA
ncbi:MAG: glycosyltransferase, partial [Anaerolineae bacterium]